MQEIIHRNYLKSFVLVSSAGALWSFGALIVRYMVAAQSYQWQYLFFRGLTIAMVLFLYLMAKEGVFLINKFKRTGISGLLGACGLVAAFSGFIWSNYLDNGGQHPLYASRHAVHRCLFRHRVVKGEASVSDLGGDSYRVDWYTRNDLGGIGGR